MSLRRLVIEIELPNSQTGQRAKEEHARLLKAVLQLVENPEWGGFAVPLHNSEGREVGRARLIAYPRTKEERARHGERQSTSA